MKITIGGDIGDAIFALCVIKAIPDGPHDIIFADRPNGQGGAFTQRAHLVIPLFESQPYVNSTSCKAIPSDIDITFFRRFHNASTTLIRAQACEAFSMGNPAYVPDGSIPWLQVTPTDEAEGRIIIARSPRYNNPLFPWRKVVEHYGERLMFVGLDSEHQTFCANFGMVQHRKIKDFLELAQLIAGADYFIGNQSSPHAVTLGLGVPMISEVYPDQPDCIYNRDNVQYVPDGSCILPDIGGSGKMEINGPIPIQDNRNRTMVPPGSWQYPGLPPSTHFTVQQRLVAQLEKCTFDEAESKLFQHNASRVPAFFRNHSNDPLATFKTAYFNAFAKQPILQP